MANQYTLTEQQKTMDLYLNACVNLYGHVTPRQFLKLYNRFNATKIRKDDLMKCGMKLMRQTENYCIYSNAIINTKEPERKIGEIAYYQEGKKYYDPTQEELLKYADPNYYPISEYTEALRVFFVEDMRVTPVIAKKLVRDIEWYIRIENPLQGLGQWLLQRGIEIKTIEQAARLFERIQELNNHCRKWANCGHTPEELFTGPRNVIISGIPMESEERPTKSRKINRKKHLLN